MTIFKKASLSPLGLLIATCLNASTAMAFHHRFPTNTNNCASPEKHFHNIFSILLEVGRLLERKRSLLSFHSDGHCPVIGAGTLPNQLDLNFSCSVAPESGGGAYKGHRPPYVKLEEEQYKFKQTEEQYKYKQTAEQEEYKAGEEYKVEYKQPLRALPSQPNQYHLPPLTAAPQVGD